MENTDKVPVASACDCCQTLPSEPPQAHPNSPGDGRMALVYAMIRYTNQLRSLNALRNALPMKMSAEAEEAFLDLWVAAGWDIPDDRLLDEDAPVRARDLLLGRAADLQGKHDEISNLLEALPISFADEKAERAMLRLAEAAQR